MSKSKPWDAVRERNLKTISVVCFYGVVGSAVLWIVAAVVGRWPLFGAGIVTMCGFAIVDIIARTEVSAMAPNRPRAANMDQMTPWRFWPHFQTEFDCRCGRRLDFKDATWHLSDPQYRMEDPGGGRFTMVCPACGQGHFKYRIDPRGVPARDAQ